jgi:ADP-ribose pyrophosphatase
MSKQRELADFPADVVVSRPSVLAKAYRDYHRYSVALKSDGGVFPQERDVLMGGKVVVVILVDQTRQELVLIRQFRLAAHLANGRGDLVEFVAGRVEPGESLVEAARRECTEEVGVAPGKLVELFSYLSSPGVTNEEITMFVASVDATKIREGALTAPDGEHVCVHRVSIDTALAALDRHTLRGSPAIIGLQWLALNRKRILEFLG